MPNNLLVTLHQHSKSPTIDLSQELFDTYLSILSFDQLHAKSNLSGMYNQSFVFLLCFYFNLELWNCPLQAIRRAAQRLFRCEGTNLRIIALRLHIILENRYEADTNEISDISRLFVAVVNVIFAQHETLEHLQIKASDVFDYMSSTLRVLKNAPGISYERSVSFSKLSTLKIDEHETILFQPDFMGDPMSWNDRVVDLSQFLDWHFLALKGLNVNNFKGIELFLRRMSDQPIQLESLSIVIHWVPCNYSMIVDFLEAFEGLQSFKVIESLETDDQKYTRDTSRVLDALRNHKTSLKSLKLQHLDKEVWTQHERRARLPVMSKIIETCKMLPSLEHLELPFHPYHALGVWDKVKMPDLRSIALHFVISPLESKEHSYNYDPPFFDSSYLAWSTKQK